jgi:hypothetical protein
MKRVIGLAAGVLLAAGSAQAAAVYSFEEVAGDVVGTLSGTIDTSGAVTEPYFDSDPVLGIGPRRGILFSGSGGPEWNLFLMSGPKTWGDDTEVEATQTTGSLFGMAADVPQTSSVLFLDKSYAGGELSGTIRFAGATFRSLGVTPGPMSIRFRTTL